MRYIQRKNEEAWLVHVPKTESGLASRHGPSRRPRRHRAAPHRRAAARMWSAAAEYVEPHVRRSVQRRRAGVRRHRRRSRSTGMSSNLTLDGTDQSGLRTGRGRSGGREPDRVRDVLRGEAPVLHRGREHLQQLRPGRGEQLLGLQPLRADHLLFAAHRPRRRRARASGDFVEQPTATTILGAAKLTGKTRRGWSLGLLDAVTGREWATDGDRTTSSAETEVEPLSNYLVGRAAEETRAAARIGAARDGGEPRSSGARPSRRSARRRPMSAASTATISSTSKRDWVVNGRIAGSQLRGSTERDLAAAARVAALLPAGRMRTHVELDPAATIARRLDRQREPESQQRRVIGVNAALWGSEPGLRFERCRLQVHERSRRRCTPSISGSNPNGHAVRAPALLRRRQVVHVEFRAARCRGTASTRSATCSSRTTGRCSRASACSGARRTIARRAADRRWLPPRLGGGFIGVESDSRKRISVRREQQRRAATRPAGGAVDAEPQPALPAGRVAGDFERARASTQRTRWRSTSTPSSIRWPPPPSVRATCSRRWTRRSSACRRASNYVLLAEDVAAGLHAAARVGRQLHRLQGAGPAADIRLHPIRQRPRQPDLRPGGAAVHRRPGRRRRDVHLQRSGLQLQVAAPERDLPVGMAARLGDVRRVDRAARRTTRIPGTFAFGRDFGQVFAAPADDVILFKIALLVQPPVTQAGGRGPGWATALGWGKRHR